MKLYIAADHLGIDVKNELVNYLKSNEINVLEIDVENKELDDYTDFDYILLFF